MADQEEYLPVACFVAVPETAGSTLYGMIDVLSSAGNIWQLLVGREVEKSLFRTNIVAPGSGIFSCGNGIPVTPGASVADNPHADMVIVPELWIGPDEPLTGRYPELMDWIRAKYEEGASIFSSCSGSVLLAETGLLDGKEATSHWGYSNLFRVHYPEVRFEPGPNVKYADETGQIVTAGGTSSWQDLIIHIVSRYCGPAEAMHIAKAHLLKWHGEGDLPYANLSCRVAHADKAVRAAEDMLDAQFREGDAIAGVVSASDLAERTLKRRFKSATGSTLIEYMQNLRIEEAKRQLEFSDTAIDDICADVGYENAAFFRQLFKRRCGLTPGEYRRMFQPIAQVHA